MCNPETPAPAAVTPAPSTTDNNDDRDDYYGGGDDDDDNGGDGDVGGESSGSGWPPSWWVDDDETGAMLIVGGVGGVAALGLCCHLLRACARKVCCFGFTDYDGNWGEAENVQDDDGGGGGGGSGGGREAVGVAGTWEAGVGDGRAGYGRVDNGRWGGGWVRGRGGRGGGGGGGGVNGNWGDADCNYNAAGEYRYDSYGAPAAAAAAAACATGPFSPTCYNTNGSSNHHHRVTPMNTPASPAGDGGGYFHSSGPTSPFAVPAPVGLLSPARIVTPTAPARDDIEDEQLQAAIAASTLQCVRGRGSSADDPVIPVAVPVPD